MVEVLDTLFSVDFLEWAVPLAFFLALFDWLVHRNG